MMRSAEGTLRILFVVRSLHVGGMEQMVIQLATGLDPARYDVKFCTIEDAGQLADRLTEKGIELVALNKPAGLKLGFALRLRKIINAWQPDIIHTHNETGHFYAALASVGRRKSRLIHTKHGRDNPENKKAVARHRLSSRLSDVIVAVSDDVAKVCEEVEKVPAHKLRTIVNGIDLESYLKIDRQGGNPQPIVFGHVGRLSEVKNQKLMIDAFAQVCREIPDCRLVIAGDGPLRNELEDQASGLGVSDQVSFLGYRSDIASVLSDFDVFLLSSVSEGTPLVVIEAMAAGLPVVATNVGGLAQMLKDQQCGFLTPSGDAQALAGRMIELAANHEMRLRFGERARQIAAARYNLRRMIDEYCDIYDALHLRLR